MGIILSQDRVKHTFPAVKLELFVEFVSHFTSCAA